LVQAFIFLLLVLDILSYRRFVSTYGRDEEPSGPETPSPEIALPLPVRPGQVDRTLALDETDHLLNGIFRWDRDHHVDMVGHQMPFLDPALFLFRQLAEDLAKILAQLHIQRLPAALGNENNVVFAHPFSVI
jgi:hypothetical protein